MSSNSARIFIGGDICPTKGDLDLFAKGDASALFGDLIADMQASDVTMVNLECPLIEVPNPIPKSGANFGVPIECVNGLAEAGIDIVSLANNHIMDHGKDGLDSTLSACQQAGLNTVGAGENLKAAQRVVAQECNGVRIGVLSCAEHEFSIATEFRAGANPIDPIEFTRIVDREAEDLDFLIVLLHAGKEHTPFPSPKLQNLSRFMIEQGASAVVCQHSHYPGVYEHYRGGFISYGQGNFLFNPYPDARDWLYEGYVVLLDLQIGKSPTVELIPYKQNGSSPGIERLNPGSAEEFKARLASESINVENSGFVRERWRDLCQDNRQLYLSILRGHGRILRNINKHVPLNNLFYSELETLILYNIVHCESKHEELSTILAQMIEGED